VYPKPERSKSRAPTAPTGWGFGRAPHTFDVPQSRPAPITQAFTEQSVPAAYDRFMRRQLFEPWAGQLVAAANLHAGQRILDVASGTGVVAHAAAEIVGPTGAVTASDISRAMLDVNRRRARPDGLAPLDFVECSATALPFADGSFGAVLCQHSLQFIPDRRTAAQEMRRVLVGGGVAAASVWVTGRPHGLFTSVVETLASEGLPEPFPGAFRWSAHCLSETELSQAFSSAGFAETTIDVRSIVAVWADLATATSAVQGMPFGPLLAGLPEAQRDRILHAIASRLPQASDGTVHCETHALVALARS
jgi:ubiquinone/menaquinone biosynthesis C-methylase UbiE